jgi:predicted GIY-YIG superfamily endonuclease
MPGKRFFTYLLRRTDDNRVLYVGQTKNPDQRFEQHLAGETSRTAYVIAQVRREGADVRMQVVRQFDTRKEACAHEWDLLRRARRAGYWLANFLDEETVIAEMPQFQRCGQPWTSSERNRVRRMFEDRTRLLDIAKAIQRSVGAVVAQLKKMDVSVSWDSSGSGSPATRR